MSLEKKAFRVGVAVLIGAIILKLLSGIPATATDKIGSRLSQALIFLQTGRLVPLDAAVTAELSTEAPSEEAATAPPVSLPAAVFTPDDAGLIELRNTSGYDVDIQELLLRPLNWNLSADSPSVLILHTHGTEGYADTDGYRSQDEQKNMIAIGSHLASALEQAGIGVLHDKTMHDADSYNGSYAHARTAIEQYLSQYPSIRLVLDIHRDSAEDAEGNQIDYTVTTEKGKAAKLMLVMGTDSGGLAHPDWQDNLALALKLHAQLEKQCSSVCRPMYLRTSRFNQDLCPGALLVEVGAAGNTQQEALLAADILAKGIIDLAYGANLQ